MTNPSRASSPQNRSATIAADNEFYAKHPEMVQDGKRVPIDPNSPAQAGMRQEWMASYAKHGGKVEPITGTDVKKAKKQANKNFPKTPPGTAVLPCPYKKSPNAANQQKGVGTAPPGSQAKPVTPLPVKRAPPPASAGQNPVCELVAVDIHCEHKGRKPGPSGVLMVVPSSSASMGDRISGNLSMKGGCGQHPSWSVGGMWVSEGRGASFSFLAKTWTASAQGFLSLKGVSPHTYQVQVGACAGGPRVYEIQAYPPGKVNAKLDVRKIIDDIHAALTHLPIPEEELSKWKAQWLQGSMEYAGAWKEEEKSWKAYYEMSISGGFDPLIGMKYRGRIWPPALIPEFVFKWTKAGLYYELKFGAKFQLAFKGSYWPDEDKNTWNERTVTGGGGGSGALSLELKLASSKIVEGAISGESGIGVEVVGTKSDDPKAELVVKFDGVKGKITLKAAWGYVEFTREFQLMKERELYRNDDLLKRFA